MKTHEGAYAHEHSLDHALEFFSKAGSLFTKTESFYEQQESALSLFQKVWIVDKHLSLKLLLWLRDCRGGAGNRSGARECLHWMGNHDPIRLEVNIGWIPLVGRWDDLRSLFSTHAERYAVELWCKALGSKDILAAKWADRNDYLLRKNLQMRIGDFRRHLAALRKNHIVEHKMCSKQWNEIQYETVPSVAMARYTKAFGRHDEERFEKYKESLKKGEAKIHAGVLFPHDCVRTAKYGDKEIADAQFDALPNFMEGTNEKIVVISDTSGSMTDSVSGVIQRVDISQGLALYCSARMPHDGPFYKKFIAFCSESKFKDWTKMTFSEAVTNRYIFDEAVGSTRVDTALSLILKTAQFFSIHQDQMPTCLLIVSDMQFHEGCDNEGTEIEKSLRLWNEAGYESPKIVYWNVAGYIGSQATVENENVGMISGFSPGILGAIFQGKDFSPLGIMFQVLEKYDIASP